MASIYKIEYFYFVLCLYTQLFIDEVSSANEVVETTTVVTVDENYCGNVSLNDTEGYWRSPNYPEPYPATVNYECTVTFDEGYQIEINIESFDLDDCQMDFVLIKPGESLHSDGSGIILARNVKKKKFIISNNSVLMKFATFGNNTEFNSTGFSIKWTRYGELTPSTETPSTTINYPTPNSTDSDMYTAYLSGVTPNEFVKNVDKFKTAVVKMAQEYTKVHNINLDEPITEENVHINLAIQCLYLWPNAQSCVEVHFAIPIFVVNATGYELNSKSLNELWAYYSDDNLKSIGWENYTVPNDNSTLTLWLIITALTVALFVGFLLYIRYVGIRFAYPIKKRKDSDVDDLVISPSTRQSDVSLWPTTNQVIPPMMFDENDSSLPYYSSNKHTSVNESRSFYNTAYTNPNFEDDFSDEEILNVTSISPNIHVNKFG